jgi:hypothetical protein
MTTPNNPNETRTEWFAKLRDPRWQRRRFVIIERDHWRCRLCFNDKRQLDVHHIVYGRENPWDSPDCELVLLCDDCHSILKHVNRLEQAESFGAWMRNANAQARVLIENNAEGSRVTYESQVADVPPWPRKATE